jgi:hypothetical protein
MKSRRDLGIAALILILAAAGRQAQETKKFPPSY